MSQLDLILQESLRREREAARTILGLLTDQMEEVDRGPRRRRGLKERFGFNGIGCCGATWGFRPPNLSVRHEEEEEEERQQRRQLQEINPSLTPNTSGPDCVGPTLGGSGMNLAAALAAERQFQGSQERDAGTQGSSGNGLDGGSGDTVAGTPGRVSLMRLLEETENRGGGEVVEAENVAVTRNDSVCCVCMERKKGAAFIPCGHTFCRACSREVWLNRGCCPLCNRSILEILDIF